MGDEAISHRGWGGVKNSSQPLLNTISNINIFSSNAALKLFKELDEDDSGEVTLDELQSWIARRRFFSHLDNEDAKSITSRLFHDIDVNDDGNMSFDEFKEFMKLMKSEQRHSDYANLHYLTELPESIKTTKLKFFSLAGIEAQLHDKIRQHTSKDSDRCRHILVMFQKQLQRSTGASEEAVQSEGMLLGITKRDFAQVLAVLGLYATRSQADALFEKYDGNGDGRLTVHEFLTYARPNDYLGKDIDRPGGSGECFDANARRGKRQYILNTLSGIPVRPNTPSQNVYLINIRRVAQQIRAKMESTAQVGQTNSRPFARRNLAKRFEWYDKNQLGCVTAVHLKKVMDTLTPLGEAHINMLMTTFPFPYDSPSGEPLFNYPAFIVCVYPDNQNQKATMQTSLRIGSRPSSQPLAAAKPRGSLSRTGSALRVGAAAPLQPLGQKSKSFSSGYLMGFNQGAGGNTYSPGRSSGHSKSQSMISGRDPVTGRMALPPSRMGNRQAAKGRFY